MSREDKAFRGAHAKVPEVMVPGKAVAPVTPEATVPSVASPKGGANEAAETAFAEAFAPAHAHATPEHAPARPAPSPAGPAPVAPAPKRSFSPAKIAIAAACALVLVGGGVAMALSGAFGESEPALPETVRATVKADGVLVAGPALQRGDALENVVEADELTGAYAGAYYRADFNGQTVYVPKKLVRLSNEAAPEQWTGYATADAIVFASPDLSRTEFLTLSLNEQVEVLDEFNGLLFVRNADGFEGFVPAGKISRDPLPEPEEATPSSSSSSSQGSSSGKRPSNSSGSSSSGSSGSTGSSGGSGGGSSTTPSTPSAPPSSDGEEVGLPTMPTAAASYSRTGIFGVQVAYAAQPNASASASQPEGEDELAYGELPEGWTPADGARGAGVAEGADGAEVDTEGVSATVLANGTQSYFCLLNRGDAVTVKVDELFGFADRTLAEDADESVKALFAAEDDSAGEGEPAEGSGSDSDSASPSASDASVPTDASSGTPTGTTGSVPLSEEDQDLLAASEDMCTVIVNGQETTLPEKILRLDAEAPYDQWDGFAAEGAVLYGDYAFTTPVQTLEVNASLRVVDVIGDALVVQTDSGLFFMPSALAGKEQFEVAEEEPAEEEVVASSGSSTSSNKGGSSYKPSSGSKPSSGGSSGGSGSSSGSGSGSSSGGSGSSGGTSGGSGSGGSGSGSGSGSSSGDNTPEWSAPVL